MTSCLSLGLFGIGASFGASSSSVVEIVITFSKMGESYKLLFIYLSICIYLHKNEREEQVWHLPYGQIDVGAGSAALLFRTGWARQCPQLSASSSSAELPPEVPAAEEDCRGLLLHITEWKWINWGKCYLCVCRKEVGVEHFSKPWPA